MTLAGNTVLALKVQGGVLLAADTALTYGKTHRFQDAVRVSAVTGHTAVAYSGDEAAYHRAMRGLEAEIRERRALYGLAGEGAAEELSAREVHGLLSDQNYEARNDMKPEYCSYLVCGFDPRTSESYIGATDVYGTHFQADYFATSLGKYFTLAVLREKWRPGLSLEEGAQILEDCLRVLWYNDCQASRTYVLARVTAEGVQLSDARTLEDDWSVAGHQDPVLV